MSRFFVRPSSPSLPLIRGYLPLHSSSSPITNHLFPPRQSVHSVGEKLFHRYPLFVTSGRCAPEDKSLMAGGGEHLLGIRTSIPLFTNHQLLITSSLRDNLCILWEKSGFIVTRYPLPVTRYP